MAGEAEVDLSPEVLTTYVWDAIKDVPGVADLHRSALQSLGEKVHLERLSPVRLEENEGVSVLEVHLVVTADAHVPSVVDTVGKAVRTYLERMAGLHVANLAVHVDDIQLDQPAPD